MFAATQSLPVLKHPIFRVMVVDFDDCLLALMLPDSEPNKYFPNGENRFLSPHLIDRAINGNYVFWKGCTHRCVQTMIGQKFATTLTNHVIVMDQPHYESADVFTTSIVNNFTSLTGLPNRGVSTLDDFSSSIRKKPLPEQCGLGFTHFLEPSELATIKAPKDAKGQFCLTEAKSHVHQPPTPIELLMGSYSSTFNKRSKNNQLVQVVWQAQAEITQMAKEIYGPDVEPILELDFFDDIEDYIINLQDENFKKSLPPNIQLNGFRHCELDKIILNPLIVVDTIKSDIDLKQCHYHVPVKKNSTAVMTQKMAVELDAKTQQPSYGTAALDMKTHVPANEGAAGQGLKSASKPKDGTFSASTAGTETIGTKNAALLATAYAAAEAPPTQGTTPPSPNKTKLGNAFS